MKYFQIVGVRLFAVSHRDASRNFEPFKLDVTTMPEGVRRYIGQFLHLSNSS